MRALRDMIVRAEAQSFGRYVALFLGTSDNAAAQAVAQPVTFRECQDGEYLEPMLKLTREQAQGLADSLWEAGFRPTQGQQSEGQFAAQGRHLEDMRALASHSLKADLPGLGRR